MALIADIFLNLRTPKDVIRQMSKNSHFRGSFNKQNVKWAKTLMKSERQQLYAIYWSFWN